VLYSFQQSNVLAALEAAYILHELVDRQQQFSVKNRRGQKGRPDPGGKE
jgi:hypothetical protein